MRVRVIAFYAAIFRIQQFFLWGKEVLFSNFLASTDLMIYRAHGWIIVKVERILKTD